MTKRGLVLTWIVVMVGTIVTLPLDLVWHLALAIKSIMIRFTYFVLRKIPGLNEDDDYITTMKKSSYAAAIQIVNAILTKIGGLNKES